MIQRDYIMRLVEQLNQVLSQLLFHKRENMLNEIESELRDASGKFLGLDWQMILTMPLVNLRNLLASEHDADFGHAYVLGFLLAEQAELEKKRGGDWGDIALKSLSFLLDARQIKDPQAKRDCIEKIHALINELHGSKKPVVINKQLFEFYFDLHDFANAESCLFFWEEQAGASAKKQGIAFYNALEKCSDTQLAAGNFSREEIAEGRADFLGRLAASQKAANL